MGNIEKIQGDAILQLFKKVQQEKIPLKVKLTNGDFEQHRMRLFSLPINWPKPLGARCIFFTPLISVPFIPERSWSRMRLKTR